MNLAEKLAREIGRVSELLVEYRNFRLARELVQQSIFDMEHKLEAAKLAAGGDEAAMRQAIADLENFL